MWSAVIGAGFEPTSRNLVTKMLEMAEIGPDDVLYDFGSGDGRIVIEAVKTYGANAVGIEADPSVFYCLVHFYYLMEFKINQKLNGETFSTKI